MMQRNRSVAFTLVVKQTKIPGKMADIDELFGSDDSEKGKSPSASSDEVKRSDHSASEEESDDDDGNQSEQSHHSPNAGSGSEDDRQNDSDVERSDVPSEQSGQESEGEGDERSDKSNSNNEAESGHASEVENHDVSDGNEAQSDVEAAHSGGEEGKEKLEQSDEEEVAQQSEDDASKDGDNSDSERGSDNEAHSDQDMKSEDSDKEVNQFRKRKPLVSGSEDESREGHSSGSDADHETSPKKKQRLLGSDEEGSLADAGPSATAQDIFGDDVGDVSSEEEGGERKERTPETNHVEFEEEPMENGEVAPEEPVPETRIEVEIPRISTNLGKEVHFVKLPNFLSVETRPYDPQWYEDEIDEDEVLDEEGRARMKLKVENTVRWRYAFDDDGNALKESNAKVVRWSDGSLSLHLGSEIFDIHKQSLMQGDHNHLFIRQGTGLQGQAVFRTKLSFRPHSTDSFTHHKMTLSLANRSLKTQKIRVLPNVGKDPEAHRSEMIKKEEDKLKASIRRENKKRRMREKSHGRSLSASYLEPDQDEEDDEGAISLSAIKNKYKKGGAVKERPSIYSSDENESLEEERERRLEKAKNMDDDDSDLDYFEKKTSEGKKKTAKIEDSDEDEGDAGNLDEGERDEEEAAENADD